MIKHIFSDIGNVILCFSLEKLCNDLGKHTDKPVEEFKHLFISKKSGSFLEAYPELPEKCDRGILKGKALYKEIVKQTGLKLNYEEFKPVWCNMFEPNEHYIDYFNQFKKKYTTTILSNIGDIHFDHLYRQYVVLKGCDDYILSYVFGYLKPEKNLLQIAFNYANSLEEYDKQKLTPKECLLIDDIKDICDAGREFGFTVIQYDKNNKERFEEEVKKLNLL